MVVVGVVYSPTTGKNRASRATMDTRRFESGGCLLYAGEAPSCTSSPTKTMLAAVTKGHAGRQLNPYSPAHRCGRPRSQAYDLDLQEGPCRQQNTKTRSAKYPKHAQGSSVLDYTIEHMVHERERLKNSKRLLLSLHHSLHLPVQTSFDKGCASSRMR